MKYLLVILSSFCWLLCESQTPLYQVITLSGQESYELPGLLFEKDGLEPYIDEATVTAHHEGHVNNYRKKANSILSTWRAQEVNDDLNQKSLLAILRNIDKIPKDFKQPVINNIGGFVNHLIYWSGMSPNHDGVEREPTGKILEDINSNFGSYAEFKEIFNQKALNLFGSGYVWLCRLKESNTKLSLIQTYNQDSPLSLHLDPILVLDVWEHAYYLKHQYRRAAHVDDFWKLIDWEQVDKLDQWWRLQSDVKHEEL